MTLYATLNDAKTAQKATGTADDSILLRNLRIVSRRLDRLFSSPRPYFAPYIEQREYLLDARRINTWDYTFRFDQPLLSLSALIVGKDTVTVANVEGWPTAQTPFRKLRLKDGNTWYDYCGNDYEHQLVKITGTWGYHGDWSNAWLSVDTVQDDPLSDSATSLTVSDIDQADPLGFTPAISAGALLRIESEYLEVTATDTATNVATVRRGVNGSTAAAHDQNKAVEVFQVEPDIRDVVARQAAFKYARRGAFEAATITDLGVVQFPSDLLRELRGVVAGYAAE